MGCDLAGTSAHCCILSDIPFTYIPIYIVVTFKWAVTWQALQPIVASYLTSVDSTLLQGSLCIRCHLYQLYTHPIFAHSLMNFLHWLLHLFHTWRPLAQDQPNVSYFPIFFLLWLHTFFHNHYQPLITSLSFPVNNICDNDQSDDALFITQANFVIPETILQNGGSQASEDHDLETHSTSSIVSTENQSDDLTTAQQNLLHDLTKHKSTALKHDGMANHFHAIATSGSAFPAYTKPTIDLRDIKYFSSTCLAKLDDINRNYQKQICELLSTHHKEVANNSRLLVTMRFQDIDSFYNNSTLRNRLDQLSRDNSIENYIMSLNRAPRTRGRKRPR